MSATELPLALLLVHGRSPGPPAAALSRSAAPRFEIEGFALLFTEPGCPAMVCEAGLAETGPADDLRSLEPLMATPPPELLDYF